MSGLILWLGALAVAAILAVGITEVGHAAITEAQAQAAADAAALAGAADGVAAATNAAQRNDAEVIAHSQAGDVITVTVRIGSSTATAHAERVVTRVTNTSQN